MELMAVIKGLEALNKPSTVTLYTDSRYVMDGATRWLVRWQSNGWRTADKKPVKNDDLWRELDAAARRHRVNWKWIAGHSGHPENTRVDLLARAAIPGMRAGLTPA